MQRIQAFTLVELPVTSERKPLGFTLVELLVVVAIIIVLIAILIPSLDRALYKAQQARCLANIKVQHMTQFIYAQDNKAYFFPRRLNSYSSDWHRSGGAAGYNLIDVMRGKYFPTEALICPIVAAVPGQSGQYSSNDWVANGGYGGWDTNQPYVYTAYMWFGGDQDPVYMRPEAGEPDPPLNTAQLSQRTTFITHRLSFGAGYAHEITHGGRGLSASSAGYATGDFKTKDMPVGFGDGSAILRIRDDLKHRMDGSGTYYW